MDNPTDKSLEYLLKAINTCIFILFVLINFYTLYKVYKSPFKTTRNSRWILFSQYSNIILQPLLCIFTWYSEQFVEVGQLSYWTDVTLGGIQHSTLVFNLTSSVMLQIDVLSIFSVYNDRIRTYIPLMRIFMICNFGVFGVASTVFNTLDIITPSELMDTFMLGSLLIYGGTALIFDNVSSFYLAFLVFKNAKSKNQERKEILFRNSIIALLIKCIVGWICAVAISFVGFNSIYTVFAINLIVSFSALHSSFITIVLLNLQHLALDHVFEKRSSIGERGGTRPKMLLLSPLNKRPKPQTQDLDTVKIGSNNLKLKDPE